MIDPITKSQHDLLMDQIALLRDEVNQLRIEVHDMSSHLIGTMEMRGIVTRLSDVEKKAEIVASARSRLLWLFFTTISTTIITAFIMYYITRNSS